MEINSLADLNKLEAYIGKTFGKLKLGDVLHSLYLLKKSPDELRPFVVAGVSLLALHKEGMNYTSRAVCQESLYALPRMPL